MKPSVLVVHRDQHLRLLVKLHFARAGWDVTEACTADAAVAATRAHRPDVVVLDDDTGAGAEGMGDLRTCSSTTRVILYASTCRSGNDGRGVDAVHSKASSMRELVRTARAIAGRESAGAARRDVIAPSCRATCDRS